MNRNAIRAAALVAAAVYFGGAQAAGYTVQKLDAQQTPYQFVGDFHLTREGQVVYATTEWADGPQAPFLHLPDGTVTYVGFGDRSTAYGWSTAVNARGQVAGRTIVDVEGTEYLRAFLYSEGQAIELGSLSNTESVASGISPLGHVTGWTNFEPSRLPVHAFVYTKEGGMRDLGTLGGDSSTGYAVNAKGQVTGYSINAAGQGHAFLYADGSMKDLGTLGGPESTGYAINLRGDVAGDSTDASGTYRAFVYRNGRMIDLGGAPGQRSLAVALNNRGDVVGHVLLADGSTRGFVHTRGRVVDLTDAVNRTTGGSYTILDARAINEAGQIVSLVALPGDDPKYRHYYLLTPVSGP